MDAAEKLSLFRTFFTARPGVVALRQEDKSYRPWRTPLTNEVILRHMWGEIMIGAYPLSPDGTTPWVAADFDGHHGMAFQDARSVSDLLNDCGIETVCNTSQSGRGVHVRVIFTEPIEAWVARRLMEVVIDETGVEPLTEGGAYDRCFPTQDKLRDDPKAIGNQIAMPLNKEAAEDRCGSLLLDAQFSPIELGDATWDRLDLYKKVTRQDIVDAMMDLGALADLTDYSEEPGGRRQNGDGGIEPKAGPLDRVLEGCEFFRMALEKPLSYHLWLALAANLAPFMGGLDTFLHISAMDAPRYKEHEARRLFADALSFHGPITCTRIAEYGWACPLLGEGGNCTRFTRRNGDKGARAPAASAHYLST